MPGIRVSHDNASARYVGFSTPSSEPDVQLSKHPALQGPAFLARHCRRVRIPLHFTLQPIQFRTVRVSLLRVAFPLPPFALRPAFPTSDYYEGSDSA